MTHKKPSPNLVTRWAAADAVAATEDLLAKLEGSAPGAFNESPFGEVNGLIDFRGFPFQAALKIVSKSFDGVDISAASFEGVWLQDCVFRSAKLDYANLGQLKDHGNRFEECSFLKTSFVGAGLGYRNTLYNKCLFEETDFRKATFIAARFHSCSFAKARLKGIDFYASSFDECSFLGRLENVWFRGGYPSSRDDAAFGEAEAANLMRNVSFAEAELIGVNFTGGCDLSSVDLPKVGDYRRYGNWRDRLVHLSEASLKWPPAEQKEAQIFVRSYLESAEKQSWMLINVAEISEEFGATLSRKMFEVLECK